MEIYCNNFGLILWFFPNLLLWTSLINAFDIWFWKLLEKFNHP